MKHLIILAALLGTAPAFAQEPPKPAATPPVGICQHGSGMAVGGMDVDEMKCQLVTAVGQVSEMSVQMIALQTKLRMAQNDLTAAKAEIERLHAITSKDASGDKAK